MSSEGRRSPSQQPLHSSLQNRQLQCCRAAPNHTQFAYPRGVLVGLAQLLPQLKLTVAGLLILPHQFDLRRRHGKADEVPREGLERLERHEQNVVHSPARHRPCHDQAPRLPVVCRGARLTAGRRQVLIERCSEGRHSHVAAADRVVEAQRAATVTLPRL